ncbi:MAG TPA: NADP-dependent malic enzyme [Nitrososphaeraceae archaeon]|nr:NADP-dependent malic enzyme [Nitrososphaeraceae archaeon]
MNTKDDAINLHRMLKGKIEIQNRVSVDNIFDDEKGTLGLIYTPGVAHVAAEISKNKDLTYDFTSKWNNVAIVSDGTRVLGLGNIGPEAASPVMEGKSVLFKILGGINAFPLCIDMKDKEDIIRFVKAIQPVFGAINIEDIESPKVLEIVERLHNELQIPVFHDDQHGTAVITLAALINALRILHKAISNIRVVIAGAGSAGYGIFRILHEAGCRNIVVTDSIGAIYENRVSSIDSQYKREIAVKTNPMKLNGSLADALRGADVFIGVSGKGNLLNNEMVRSMHNDPIVFALSNPDPEILPYDALKAGARIVATGRSDFANQVNNAVVFPAILRALLDLRVKNLGEDMLVSVAIAIADMVDSNNLKYDYVIPKVNDPRLIRIVSDTLRDAIGRHIEKKKYGR